MIQYHMTAGLMIEDIAKLLKDRDRFFPGNVRKKPHLYGDLSQKNIPFLQRF